MWIDADAWVQSPAIITRYLSSANADKMSIAPELGVAYRWFFGRAPWYHAYKVNAWTAAFGAAVVARHSLAPLLNSGVFAISGHSAVWAAWTASLSLSLRHGVQYLSEQLARQKTLIETNLPHPLTSRANWMSHYALPKKRSEDGIWIERRLGGQQIGITHLVAEKMRETYLCRGMLYEGGDYLSPEDVTETCAKPSWLGGAARSLGKAPAPKPSQTPHPASRPACHKPNVQPQRHVSVPSA